MSNEEKESSTRLENLPPEIKSALDKLIAQGNGAANVKSVLEEQFKSKTSLLPASKSTYDLYLAKHRERILKEAEFTKELAQDANESIDDLHAMIETGLDENTSTEGRREVFESIAKNLEVQRVRITRMLSDTNVLLAPQYESILVAIERERRNTIAKMHELEDILNRNESERTFKQVKRLIQRFLDSGFLRVIAEVYKNQHLIEARTLMAKYWQETWDTFKLEDTKQRKKDLKTKK
ncbi:MAG: hypothetical protein V3U54_08815 [Thermodesulfobacteriota bacterium]